MAQSATLQRLLFPLAARFVAGDSADDAIAAVRRLNAAGMTATLDVLGEDVHDVGSAARIRDEYVRLIGHLAAARVVANLSLKLSALGLLVDEPTARVNYTAVLDAASESLADPFVRVDMEGSALLEPTLGMFRAVFGAHPNTGTVLQAYLRRTPRDIDEMIALGARVRYCKGAYKETAAIAIHEMPRIREAYVAGARALLARGTYPAIATHDPQLIDAVRAFAAESGIAAERFEFQMLYGVRPDLQAQLVAAGYRVRIYVPFGSHWAKYFRRRVMERRENLWFAIRSMIARDA